MLTNAAAKAAGAQTRAYKLFDAGGLFLFIAPSGLKSWRLKYRWRGREKLLTIGRFPEVSIAQARLASAEAKDALGRGLDPSGARARAQDLASFEQVARAWHAKRCAHWSAAHAGDVIGSLERDVFPAIGAEPVAAIGAPALLELLERIEGEGRTESARRLRQRLSAVFRFAMTRELRGDDPAAALAGSLSPAQPARPHAALTAIEDCRALLEACEAIGARPETVLASRFLALTAVRLDALRGMRWNEIEGLDGPEPVWRVPAARMKLARAKKGEARFDHLVPLVPAAVSILHKLQIGRSADHLVDDNRMIGGSPLVFPGRTPETPIGEGTLRELYIRAGFEGRHVPHGWRASFSTILNEELGPEWRAAIDQALAHVPKDKVEAAYNRSSQLARRRELFARWAAMLAPGGARYGA